MSDASMQDILSSLIHRYHRATIAAAVDSKLMDGKAMACAQGAATATEDMIDWIRRYGVSRVGSLKLDGTLTPFAEAMAQEAMRYFEATDPGAFKDESIASVMKHFAHLREGFGKIYAKGSSKAERKMQSLTSKVLWLRMPQAAPIYDGQALAAIVFLVKLQKATAGENYDVNDKGERHAETDGTCESIDKQWGWSRGKLSRETLDNYWYQDFLCSHQALYRQCENQIDARIPEEMREWLTPFRYFDKLLWILGDSGRDYSLMTRETEFRKSAGPQSSLAR
jgi:hypothetical protein